MRKRLRYCGGMKTNMKSKYQLGWIGLRVTRHGRAAATLKRSGWMRSHHADRNNRNAFDWVKPTITHDQFDHTNWNDLASRGLEAVAFWLTDAQWGRNAGLTDRQWQDGRLIELEFNAKWPYGKR